MIRVSELKTRDVINIDDGRRLGFIRDIDLDVVEGKVKAIILPGTPRIFGFFGRRDDLIISWEKIIKIGVDVILVDLEGAVDFKGGKIKC
ncbi:MAG: YlmC/YmxH family sporulation protein [Clostridia bacterium]|nr:YlmC/YmxH family sporulation protein [Clostridia bacterium]